jgi:3-methyladenine DNA glycosylase AlkD
MNVLDKIQDFLKGQKSQKLKDFNAKLIPNIDSNCVLGVKLPVLRNFAKQLYKECDCTSFLQSLPHTYHEENHLHAFIIEQVKDYNECLRLTQEFLPFVNNWAVCDCFKPAVFKANKQKLLPEINKWITSEHVYTVRFGVNMLMSHFLDNDFCPEYALWVANVKQDDYYLKMVVAWYFATALAKQWESVISLVEQKVLPTWTHNKTIQKAVESFRISTEQKEYLKTLKIKEKK